MGPSPGGALKVMRNYHEYDLATSAALMGRPLAGMRAYDVTRVVDYLLTRGDINPRRISVAARGDLCPVALLASALDPRIADGPVNFEVDPFDTAVMLNDCPDTFFVPDLPPDFSMQFYVPGILNVADMPVLAALTAPRGLMFSGTRNAAGSTVSPEETVRRFGFTARIYKLLDAAGNLSLQ